MIVLLLTKNEKILGCLCLYKLFTGIYGSSNDSVIVLYESPFVEEEWKLEQYNYVNPTLYVRSPNVEVTLIQLFCELAGTVWQRED
jgi:hypothetical protein